MEPDAFDAASRPGRGPDRVPPHPGGERRCWRPPPPLPIYADRIRLAQAISNLIENALTYAPTGPIVVRAVAGQVDDPVAGASQAEGPPDKGRWGRRPPGACVSPSATPAPAYRSMSSPTSGTASSAGRTWPG